MRAIPENDTFALYIDTTKDVEDEEMEVDTFEKLGIYILQDEQNFKEYLQYNNIVNFEIDVDEKTQKENDEEEDFDFTNNELGPKSKIMQDFRKKLKRERKRQNKKRKI